MSNLVEWTKKRNMADPLNPGEKRLVSPMQKLWERLDGLMPGAWASNFQRPGSVANWEEAWAHEFVRENLTMDEIAKGLAQVAKWSPQEARFGRLTVQQFIAWCRPQLDDEDAFHEAVVQLGKRRAPYECKKQRRMVTDDVWSEPAIYWAAISMPDIMHVRAYRDIAGRWSRALAYARENPKGPVPLYMLELPAPEKRSIPEAEQKRIVADLLGKLGKSGVAGAKRGSKISLSHTDDSDLAQRRQKALDELDQMRRDREARSSERTDTEPG